jgi:hypothetical protein
MCHLYGLDGPAMKFGGGGADFPRPSTPGWVTDSASNSVGTESFPGVKRPERGVNRPPHLAQRLKKE